ncbi:hypothetical protein HY346_01215 [Candidatus Microgenomates bacterium]|nr:hypothetical protein [Candidatus Microgenomates bacterium]
MILWMHYLAWQKICEFVRQAKHEINGFAYVQVVNKSSFYVMSPDDVFITDQEVTGSKAENTAATVALAMAKAQAVGRAGELRLQWHSHSYSSTFFSGQDTGTIEGYREAGATWMISLVTNKRGEVSVRLDLFTPLRMTGTLELQTFMPESDPLVACCKAEIDAMVKEKPVEVVVVKAAAKAIAKLKPRGRNAHSSTVPTEGDLLAPASEDGGVLMSPELAEMLQLDGYIVDRGQS